MLIRVNFDLVGNLRQTWKPTLRLPTHTPPSSSAVLSRNTLWCGRGISPKLPSHLAALPYLDRTMCSYAEMQPPFSYQLLIFMVANLKGIQVLPPYVFACHPSIKLWECDIKGRYRPYQKSAFKVLCLSCASLQNYKLLKSKSEIINVQAR